MANQRTGRRLPYVCLCMKARPRPTVLTVLVIAVVLGLAWGGAKLVGRGTHAPAPVVPAAIAAETVPVAGPALTAGQAAGAAAAAAAAVNEATVSVDALDKSTSGTEFGVAVQDRTTGRTSVGADGATPFYSASVVKLYTVVDICTGWRPGQSPSRPPTGPTSGRP